MEITCSRSIGILLVVAFFVTIPMACASIGNHMGGVVGGLLGFAGGLAFLGISLLAGGIKITEK